LTGLDLAVHAETAYDHGVLGHGTAAHATVLAHSSDKAPAL